MTYERDELGCSDRSWLCSAGARRCLREQTRESPIDLYATVLSTMGVWSSAEWGSQVRGGGHRHWGYCLRRARGDGSGLLAAGVVAGSFAAEELMPAVWC
jgi:hypothetical protein